MFGLKNDEMLTCFLLIIVGYTLAKMFSRRCEGFSVGADDFAQSCDPNSRNKGDYYCQTRVGSGTSCNQTCMEWDSIIPIYRSCKEYGHYCN